MNRQKTVAILGITGRLGPAVAAAFSDWNVRGLSRRLPNADEFQPEEESFALADRQTVATLTGLVDGCDAVVDLIGFSTEDAQSLIEAIGNATSKPKHLVFASSTAECSPGLLGASETAPHDPDNDYGRGKKNARLYYEEHFAGTVHSLILPRLVASADPHRREQAYLEAGSTGRVLIPGSGDQRQIIAPVAGVAQVILRLCEAPQALRPGMLNVGPPNDVTVEAAVEALINGAGIRAEMGRHPDPRWRGPHGGGHEPLDTTLLQQTFADIVWGDPITEYQKLGQWLAENSRPTDRPKPLVRASQKSFRPMRVIDVHGHRRDVVLEQPNSQLRTIGQWLSPAFYVNTGRPCNSLCVYCAVPPHADTKGFTPVESLQPQITAGVSVDCDKAILIGGEPTIYPALFEALDMLREAGLGGDHVIMTNGLRLSDAAFVDQLIEGGVGTIHLSIDTADAGLYDQISRTPGRADQQWLALDNILARPQLNLYIYTCVTLLNGTGLPELLDKLHSHAQKAGCAAPPVVMAFLKPIGDGLTHREKLLPDFQTRAQIARAAAQHAQSLGMTVAFRNLQACLVPELLPNLMDYYFEDYSVDVTTKEPEPYSHNEYWSHVDACSSCEHKSICPGVYRDDQFLLKGEPFQALDSNGLRIQSL